MAGKGKSQEEGARLLKLALAMRRDPAAAVASLSGSGLPESMEIPLRVANGEAELLAWARKITGAGDQELKSACIAFVERVFFGGGGDPFEHVYFGDGTDPFRILGLNPWATPEDIKEHYRLLIRLFHPDRGVAQHASAGIYAAMINQAYSTLKKSIPASPSHDVLRHHAPPAAAHADMARNVSIRLPRPARPAAGSRLGFLTPTRVLAGVATIATLIVAMLFLQQDPASPHREDTAKLVHASQDGGEPRQTWDYENLLPERKDPPPSPPAAPQPLAQAPVPLPAPVPAPPPAIDPPPNAATVKVKPPRRPEPPAAVVIASTGSLENRLVQTLSLDRKVSQPVEPAVVAATAESPLAPGVRKAADAGASIRETPDVAPPVLIPSTVLAEHHALSEMALLNVIAQFIGSYANGDLDAFMSLFDENVRTDEPGGKAGLRKTYAIFFGSTLTREMLLKDLSWQHSGELATGVASYRVTIVPKPGRGPSSSYGSLKIEVAQKGAKTVILGFFHRAASK